MKKKEVILISHTHWDREWYLSVEQYRFRLVRLMDKLLDIIASEPDYHSFWLDGQTIALDDYLAVCPEKRELITNLLHKGKILIGPWYVQADEFMVTGESCIRNLFIGIKAMRAAGQDNRIGYLADNFGHPSQMPQILRGFGIDNAIFWRGYKIEDIDGIEQTWTGTDGSAITAICLVCGYSNAADLYAVRGAKKDTNDPLEGQPQHLMDCISTLRKQSRRGPILLMNGVDHAFPTANLKEHIRRLEELNPDFDIRHGSLSEYLANIQKSKLPRNFLRGELNYYPGLSSTGSARILQKKANSRLQDLLIYYAEPLHALASAGGLHQMDGFLRRAWQLLIKNHAHDSLSGAHSDNVAADNANRYRRAEEIVQGIISRCLGSLSGQIANETPISEKTAVWIYNPCGWKRPGIMEIQLEIPRVKEFDHIVIRRNGKECPSQLLSINPDDRIRFRNHTNPSYDQVFHAKIIVDIGAMQSLGFEPLDVQVVTEPTYVSRPQTLSPQWGILDNGILRVKIHSDASLDIKDLRSGEEIQGLHKLIDEPDLGNQYESAQTRDGRRFQVLPGAIEQGNDGPLCSTYRVRTSIATDTGILPLTITISLLKGEDYLRVNTEIDNKLRDHRLCMAFPLPSGCTRTWAHTPFDVVERKVKPLTIAKHDYAEEGLPPYEMDGSFKTLSFVAAVGRRSTLSVIGCGLYEYRQPRDSMLQIPLLRSVGTVFRCFSMYSAEEGQVLQKFALDYAIGLSASHRQSEILKQSLEFRLAPLAYQIYGSDTVLKSMSFCSLSRPDWIITSVKRPEKGKGFIVRFFSLAQKTEKGTLECKLAFKQAFLLRLDETRIKNLPKSGRSVSVTLAPRQIATVLFET